MGLQYGLTNSAVGVFFLQTYGSGGMDQQQQNRALFECIRDR